MRNAPPSKTELFPQGLTTRDVAYSSTIQLAALDSYEYCQAENWNFRRVFNSQLPTFDRAERYPADFGQRGTPMGSRLSRGRPAITIDADTGREHYIIICRYFQLHGTEGEFRDPPLKGYKQKGNQPIISAEEILGDERLEPMLDPTTPTGATSSRPQTPLMALAMKAATLSTSAKKRNRSPSNRSLGQSPLATGAASYQELGWGSVQKLGH